MYCRNCRFGRSFALYWLCKQLRLQVCPNRNSGTW